MPDSGQIAACDWDVRDLGVMSYADAWTRQQELVAQRKQAIVPNTLLLVEHPHVFTLGRNARAENVLRVPAGAEVHHTNRGGDVTYHGPGQLVGYPIVDLAAMQRRDIAWYMRTLEEALIAAVAAFGISGSRIPGLTGVWVGGNKIAAMGVHLSRWVTCHGFALNVNTDLAWFDCIVPCGIRDHGVTSMQRELGRDIVLSNVKTAVARTVCEKLVGRPEGQGISAPVLDSGAQISHSGYRP
jgi:lipoyl(octanoyl) transferase